MGRRQMLRSRFLSMISTGAFLAGCLVCFAAAHAQRAKQIGNFPGTNLRCAYFWDVEHGVVAGDYHIFYYRSGAWKESTYPELPGVFRSLRLLDGKNLYAASGSTCVWESTDSGATWQKTTATLVNADDIYLDPTGVIRGMNITGVGMMQGTSFATTNGMNCVAARDDAGSIAFSSDGGVSWADSRTKFTNGYCCVADSCSGNFYTITDELKYEVLESTNGGQDWFLIHDFGNGATDILAGGNFGVLYAQGGTDVFGALIGPGSLKQAGGYGWGGLGIRQPAGGVGDRRMFSFGQYDNYLVAMYGGEVWLWSSAPQTSPGYDPLVVKNVLIQDCTIPTRDTVDLSWPYLADTVTVWSDDDGRATITPDTIKITSATKPIIFHLSIPPGQKRTTFGLHASTYFECQNIQWDTSISILISPLPKISMMDSIALLTCSDTTVPISITAPACDTFSIDSIASSDASGIFVLNSSWNKTLFPNQKNLIHIEVHGNKPGTYFTSVSLWLTSKGTGLSFDTT
ncbi:MAG: WD40/YVTN/BNR-like repeat-containing protein, partial [Candidatus Kapaibacterium sp.]